MRSDLFAKLMMLTTSSNDAEALAALRKANAMLASDKTSWAELLEPLLEPRREPRKPRSRSPSTRRARKQAKRANQEAHGHDDADVIEAMFEVLYQRGGLSAGFGEFVRSMHQQFHALGYLSARQFTVLRTAAERHGFEAA